MKSGRIVLFALSTSRWQIAFYSWAAVFGLAVAGAKAQGQNLVANGTFSANASSYTSFPGYNGGSNPSAPTDWTVSGAAGSSGINGYDAVTSVFFDNNFGSWNHESWTSTSGNTVNDFWFQQNGGSIYPVRHDQQQRYLSTDF